MNNLPIKTGRQSENVYVDKRVRRTEKAITEAFFSLLETRDYDKITVSALACEARIDRKTFYLHYRSVDELADSILRTRARNLVQTLLASARGRETEPGSRSLRVDELMRAMWGEIDSNLSSVRSQMRHMPLDQVLDRLPNLLTEAFLECGCLSNGLTKQQEKLCASFMGAGLIALMRSWAFDNGSKCSPDELAELAETLVFEGVTGVVKPVNRMRLG